MYGHTATVDEENGSGSTGGSGSLEGGGTAMMLVLGGLPFQDFSYALDLHEMKWKNINVQYKRQGHSANLIDHSIYLFGGRDSSWYQ